MPERMEKSVKEMQVRQRDPVKETYKQILEALDNIPEPEPREEDLPKGYHLYPLYDYGVRPIEEDADKEHSRKLAKLLE